MRPTMRQTITSIITPIIVLQYRSLAISQIDHCRLKVCDLAHQSQLAYGLRRVQISVLKKITSSHLHIAYIISYKMADIVSVAEILKVLRKYMSDIHQGKKYQPRSYECERCLDKPIVPDKQVIDHVFAVHRNKNRFEKYKIDKKNDLLHCICSLEFKGDQVIDFLAHLWKCKLSKKKRVSLAIATRLRQFAEANGLQPPTSHQEQVRLVAPAQQDLSQPSTSRQRPVPALSRDPSLYYSLKRILTSPVNSTTTEKTMIKEFVDTMKELTCTLFRDTGVGLERTPRFCIPCNKKREDDAKQIDAENWRDHYVGFYLGYHQIWTHTCVHHKKEFGGYMCTCGNLFPLADSNVLWFLQYVKHLAECHFDRNDRAFARYRYEVANQCKQFNIHDPFDPASPKPKLITIDGEEHDEPVPGTVYRKNQLQSLVDLMKEIQCDKDDELIELSLEKIEDIIREEIYNKIDMGDGPNYTDRNKFHCRSCELAYERRYQDTDYINRHRNNRDFCSPEEFLGYFEHIQNWALDRPADANYAELFDTDLGIYGWMVDVLAYMTGQSHTKFTGRDVRHRMVFYHMSLYRSNARPILNYCKERPDSIAILPNSCLCKRKNKSMIGDPLDLRNTHRHVIIIFRNQRIYHEFIGHTFEMSAVLQEERTALILEENRLYREENERLGRAEHQQRRVERQAFVRNRPDRSPQYWEDGYVEPDLNHYQQQVEEQQRAFSLAEYRVQNHHVRLRAKNRYMIEITTNWHMGNTIKYVSSRKWIRGEKQINPNSLYNLNRFSEHRSWNEQERLARELERLEQEDAEYQDDHDQNADNEDTGSCTKHNDGYHFDFTRPVLAHFKPMLFAISRFGLSNWLGEIKQRNPEKLYSMLQFIHCNVDIKKSKHFSYDCIMMDDAKKYLPTYVYKHAIPLNTTLPRDELQKALDHAITKGALLSPDIDRQYEYFKDLEHMYIVLPEFVLKDFREVTRSQRNLYNVAMYNRRKAKSAIAYVRRCIALLLDQEDEVERLIEKNNSLSDTLADKIGQLMFNEIDTLDITDKEKDFGVTLLSVLLHEKDKAIRDMIV